jgi:class 3 adenylate cyclase/pimeloyl-ACP methyl ester carboxylesterase
MRQPEVHYARSGEVSIAYQIVGEAPGDIVYARGFTGDLLSTWDQPLLARHILGLAELGRVLLLDKRGTGLSDRVAGVPTLETRMDDLRAVMDAVGSEQAAVWSGQEGTRMSTLFAATYPERTTGLVVLDPSAKGLPTVDYPWAPTEAAWRETLREVRDGWGTRAFLEKLLRTMAPSVGDDEEFRDWFVTHMRRSLSPGAATAFYRMMMEADVSEVLPAVRVPTLILFSPAQRGPAEYFDRRIPNTQIVELSTMRGDFTWLDDETHEATMRATGNFIEHLSGRPEPDTILSTVLFTDIVGSTERQAAIGDRDWRELVERHHAIVRDQLARWRGVENDTAGDGFYATFDGPARAIRCAMEVAERVRDLGIEIRAGVHTGECEIIDGKAGGITVSIGARVASAAGAGEVLVSSTVKDLVAGSGLRFEDRGEHELKGVPGPWRIYTVAP